jgi:hypothetical protein
MTPAEIKDAYKVSLEALVTLTAVKDAAEVDYGAACAALAAEASANVTLKAQLDTCIKAGTI